VVCLAATVIVVGCGQASRSPQRDASSPLAQASRTPVSTVLPLLSDGWKKGDPASLALAFGTFHAVRSGSVACAWLGDDKSRAFLCPTGYQVAFAPSPVWLMPTDTLWQERARRSTSEEAAPHLSRRPHAPRRVSGLSQSCRSVRTSTRPRRRRHRVRDHAPDRSRSLKPPTRMSQLKSGQTRRFSTSTASDRWSGVPNRCAVMLIACSRRNGSISMRPASVTGCA
jgi:hypothetical protein